MQYYYMHLTKNVTEIKNKFTPGLYSNLWDLRPRFNTPKDQGYGGYSLNLETYTDLACNLTYLSIICGRISTGYKARKRRSRFWTILALALPKT